MITLLFLVIFLGGLTLECAEARQEEFENEATDLS